MEVCPFCDFVELKRGETRQHMLAKHSSQHPFQCSDCGYSSNYKKAILKHVAKKHHCAKVYTIPDYILFPWVFTPQSPLDCPCCPHSATTLRSLGSHMRIHKLYSCHICKQAFFRRQDALKHFASF